MKFKNFISPSSLCLLVIISCTGFSPFESYAQRVQLGIGAAANNTFFHKGESQYNDDIVGRGIAPGIGLHIPVNIRFSESWHLKTGVGFHNRKYAMILSNFNVDDFDGRLNFDAVFNCLEVPLLFSFRTPSRKKYKLEYSLGMVSCYYMTAGTGFGYETGAETMKAEIILLPSKGGSFFAPELYGGVTLIHMIEGNRRQEFTISYQYGFTPSTKYDVLVFVGSPVETKSYELNMKPNLSCFKLSYAFYPKWLNWGIVEE